MLAPNMDIRANLRAFLRQDFQRATQTCKSGDLTEGILIYPQILMEHLNRTHSGQTVEILDMPPLTWNLQDDFRRTCHRSMVIDLNRNSIPTKLAPSGKRSALVMMNTIAIVAVGRLAGLVPSANVLQRMAEIFPEMIWSMLGIQT